MSKQTIVIDQTTRISLTNSANPLAIRPQEREARTLRRRVNTNGRKPPTVFPTIRLQLERIGQIVNRPVRESRRHIREGHGSVVDRPVPSGIYGKAAGSSEVLRDPLHDAQIEHLPCRGDDALGRRLARRQVLVKNSSGGRAGRGDGHADFIAESRLDVNLQVVEKDCRARVELVEGEDAGVAFLVEEVVEADLERTGRRRGLLLPGDEVGVAREADPDGAAVVVVLGVALRESDFGHDHGRGDGFVGSARAGQEGAGPVVGADLADGALWGEEC